MLQKLQESYLGSPVSTVRYHQNGNFTSINDALHSGAVELGQLRIDYDNQTRIYANLGSSPWEIEEGDQLYLLPPEASGVPQKMGALSPIQRRRNEVASTMPPAKTTCL